MALATQCPHCHTTFRVAHDQLKLRAGLVRCGACKQIFNGIESLLRPEELEQATAWPAPVHRSPATEPAIKEAPLSPKDKPLPSIDFDLGDLQPEPEENNEPKVQLRSSPPDDANAVHADTEAPPAAESEVRKNDPLLRMTLMDIAHERREAAIGDSSDQDTGGAEDDAVGQAIDDLESKPWRREQDATEPPEGDALDQADAAEYEEPSFVKQGRRKQRIGRAIRIFMAVGSVFLLFALFAQGTYVFRDRIAAWIPQTKPILADACEAIGCQVGLPAQIESVSIESSELQTLSADSNTFVLTVLLRNHGATEQAWPHIELTLNDANEKPVARRIFAPREYLGDSADMKKGFGAHSEQPVKLHFELAQLKASGYRVYLFYP